MKSINNLFCAIFLIGIGAVSYRGSSYALPITVNVKIPKVTLHDGTEAGDDELYSEVNIDNQDFQDSSRVDFADLETRTVNWSFSGTIDPRDARFTSNYKIPIEIELWEDDPVNDDHMDINIVVGEPDIILNYDLKSPGFFLNDQGMRVPGVSGNNSGTVPDNATLFYEITSNLFQYAFVVDSVVTELASGLFQFNFTLNNLSNSTFDIGGWASWLPYGIRYRRSSTSP